MRRFGSSTADASENPNFWSSCPVDTYSWVCASTPGVTRKRTRAGLTEVDEPVDLVEGIDDDPPDAVRDRALELGDRLVVAVENQPLGWEFDATAATANSPPVQTSSDSPSSSTQRATERHRNALPA